MKEYISLGLDKELVDPDKGANIARKLRVQAPRFDSAEVDTTVGKPAHLSPAPPAPEAGWTSRLSDLPTVTFASLYQHFVEGPTRAVAGSADHKDKDEAGPSAASSIAGSSSNADCAASFRGLSKGFRFFKDGHVQSIEYHSLPGSPGLSYVRAQVLPSMKKGKKYLVRICLVENGDVHTAHCVCPAGLGGRCNHVAGLLYALEEFVREGLREASSVPCTSRLQAWNKPRPRNVPPSRVYEVRALKEEYGKKKRRKKELPFFDPRPANSRLPDPEEHAKLYQDLLKEHTAQLAADTSGNVAKYGSSCLLKLMEESDPDSEESSSDDDSGSTSESEQETGALDNAPADTCTCTASTIKTPDDFYKQYVVITHDEAQQLEEDTRQQAQCSRWYRERRIRVTATLGKAVAARRKDDFTPVLRRKLESTFHGTKATKWGKDHEDDAVLTFQTVLSDRYHSEINIESSGMVVDEAEPWLAASPDGHVTLPNGDKYLVEVKCPYTARNMMVTEAASTIKAFCLKKEGGRLQLKHTHEYYYQIQLQMHVCNVTNCFFLVWTLKDMAMLRLSLDKQFLLSVIPKLKRFYFDELLPALTAEVIRSDE